jgi:HK97 family phage major capsid protein
MRNELRRLSEARDKVEKDLENMHEKAIAEGRSLSDSEAKMVEILERKRADLTASIAEEKQYLRHDRKEPSVRDANQDTAWEAADRHGRSYPALRGPDAPELWADNQGNKYLALAPQHRVVDYVGRRAPLPDGIKVEELSVGRMLRAMFTGNWRHAEAEQRVIMEAAGSTGVNESGGFLVPEPLSSMVIDLARAKSVCIAAGARTIPGTSDQLVIARVTGDPTIEFKGENAAFTESGPTFDQVRLVFRTMGAYCVMSRELADDALNAPELWEFTMSKALGVMFDSTCLAGTGAELGFVGICYYDGTNVVESIGSVDYEDFLNAIQRIEVDKGEPRTMIISPSVKYDLAALLVNSEANHYATPPPDVAGLQKLVTTSVPSGYSVVGDFRSLLIGLRQEPRIEISTVSGDVFKKHQLALKITMRCDAALSHATDFCVLSGIT